MGKCTKCGTKFVGTAENPPPDGLCRYCEMDKLKDALDMNRDEFMRIVALLRPTRNPVDLEIVGICERAIEITEQTVPVVVQRDKLQTERNQLRRALVGLVGVDTKYELDCMEAQLRIMPVPEQDRMHTINAINALRDIPVMSVN